ncbi:alpha amylase [Cutibacterium acnes C1]|nr:alpha amylase, catalytic domain protein [Cutibacterium acnes TypeIA2 P.acn33]AEW83188.1 alpha amylase, catalytic domain protein [Cutibacterium acnes TypeIA2 P.acn31]AFU40382.1 alpha amylase [Cutibacterium acnes C1]AID36922.1 alpha-amylase [Cutibacterium acnes hdn-1]EFD02438.1 alpha amylase, catalytic domain protein [Cutibacterium acnes SK187]KEY34189.1 alpha-amylase 3 [Cutibacterium acnes]MCU7477316.1 alpha amylase [Cutibacterium acnes 25G]MCW5107080.1 alpha amylase, catalytic domain prot
MIGRDKRGGIMAYRPGWVDHLIGWHVYPLGFVGAPARLESQEVSHRLAHLGAWLDHAVALGCSSLALGPVFSSASHGYDTLDYFTIDPRLGDDDDFDHLLQAAHARGLSVLLDGVFNHVSRRNRIVQDAQSAGPDSDAGRMVRWCAGRLDVFEGHSDLVALNHDNPAVREHVTRIMNYWCGRGVDGWRLDAAYSVNPEFWAAVLPSVREKYPDVWIFGEVIHGDYASIVRASGMDSVTQYELWKGIWSSIESRNFFELDHALGRHNEFSDAFTPMTFVGNHDVTRIASRVGQDGAVLATAILATIGGIPLIYYGDELAYRGVKEERFGGDDDIRPVFPASPADLSNLGADTLRAHQSLLGLRRRHPWLVDARTESLDLTNERYVYRTGVPGVEPLIVELDVRDGCSVLIREAGQVVWSSGA